MKTALKILSLCLIFTSCGEYENLEVMKKLDKRVDSIFYSKKDSINKLVDSICVKNTVQWTQEAMDSIKKIQLQKIEHLIHDK